MRWQHRGELVHLDVLHLFALKGQKPTYEFTVVDGYTRMAYAVIAPKRTTDAALTALQQAQTAFGFPIKSECSLITMSPSPGGQNLAGGCNQEESPVSVGLLRSGAYDIA